MFKHTFNQSAERTEYRPTGRTRIERHSWGATSRKTEKQTVHVVRSGKLELTIDVAALERRLGHRALINTSGRTALLSGIIKCRCLPGYTEQETAKPIPPLAENESYEESPSS